MHAFESEIVVLRQEAGGRRQEEREGKRRKEEEGGRRKKSIFTCIDMLPPIKRLHFILSHILRGKLAKPNPLPLLSHPPLLYLQRLLYPVEML